MELVFLRAARPPPGGRRRAGRRARSARSAWPPSGAGRTSGCRSRGRRRCCPRPRWPACSPPWPAARWAASSAAALVRPRPFPPLRAERLAALAGGARLLVAVVGWGAAAVHRRPARRERDAARRARRRRARRSSATDPGEPGRSRRGPGVPQRDRLAGRRQRARSARARGPGRLPDHQADPGARRLEGDGAPPAGDALVAVPIYLPRDRAIPAPEVPAPASFTREFRPRPRDLQRERKEGVSGALTAGAYLTVLAIALVADRAASPGR